MTYIYSISIFLLFLSYKNIQNVYNLYTSTPTSELADSGLLTQEKKSIKYQSKNNLHEGLEHFSGLSQQVCARGPQETEAGPGETGA